MKKTFVFPYIFFFIFSFSFAQTQQEYSSSQIYKKIEKLNFLGTALYVAAHPDDENTSMISYLSNKTNARVAYLALNRGDGGQNLIGTEISELLGVIRTEELLAARRIDGGEQFFTRSNDFGYSKNPKETFNFWDKEKVLADVVWTFRKFRPDVVINRFNHRTEGDTHGHHTASAVLSNEAFDLAGDKTKFPEQLKYYTPWQPKRMYFNDSWFFYGSKEKYLEADHTGFLQVNVGEYLPVLGKSNTEISASSRSQHKSQGFGSAGERGEELHFFEPVKGDFKDADKDIFAGINTSWSRIAGGAEIGKILYKVQEDFDFTQPDKSIPELLKAYQLIQKLKDDYWRELKTNQIKEIIAACAGLYLEVSTQEATGTLGEEIKITLEAINRSNAEVLLESVIFDNVVDEGNFKIRKDLAKEMRYLEKKEIHIPVDANYSTPYWLTQPHSIGMYTVDEQQMIGLPKTPPQLIADFALKINGVLMNFKRELIYKISSQTHGEVKEPFAIVPDVSLEMMDKVLVFADENPREIKVEVKAFKDDISGVLKLRYPADWKVSPQQIELNIAKKGQTKTAVFTLTPPKNQTQAEVSPEFKLNGKIYSKELHLIDYPHIPTKTVLLNAHTKVNRLDIKIGGKNIGYIEGGGDKIPEGLREIGYEVTMLSEGDLTLDNLKKFDAVITGIRAYNTNDDLVLNQNILFDYVKSGGTLVTQYSQLMGIKTKKLAPLEMNVSRERVTDEESLVRFLAPNHPVLNVPNKITQKDFEGWVQERGLYFADKWSDDFTAILGMHDQGEEELAGGLLVAPYGKGYYVYTGLSFFRELPAGVPGAFRLFANILALE